MRHPELHVNHGGNTPRISYDDVYGRPLIWTSKTSLANSSAILWSRKFSIAIKLADMVSYVTFILVEGEFSLYVDTFFEFFDPSLPHCRQFVY